jgi:hypothetical protein
MVTVIILNLTKPILKTVEYKILKYIKHKLEKINYFRTKFILKI